MFDRFRANERAIEGLPIRLVIALVVGVASLSVMMNTISGLSAIGVTELDVKPSPEVVGPGQQSLTVQVVTPEGEPVADATVVAKGGTATLASIRTATTGANGTATLSVAPRLGPNQDEGTVTLSVKPPAGGQYVDERENTKVLVVAD
ncbi:MAG: carboxypeptidase regulatory-like domain-containing protein [Haloarculaceae archaeon]